MDEDQRAAFETMLSLLRLAKLSDIEDPDEFEMRVELEHLVAGLDADPELTRGAAASLLVTFADLLGPTRSEALDRVIDILEQAAGLEDSGG